MSEISKYKEECMRRFKETQKYQKYDKEDLIDELYEKDNLLQQKENIIKEVREYIEENEKEYGSLEDNEKIILGILDKENK